MMIIGNFLSSTRSYFSRVADHGENADTTEVDPHAQFTSQVVLVGSRSHQTVQSDVADFWGDSEKHVYLGEPR